MLYQLIPFNLLNTKFGWHDFFPEPKVALTKELVYKVYLFQIDMEFKEINNLSLHWM